MLSPEDAVDEHQSKTTKFLAGNQRNWSQMSQEAAQVSLLALSSLHILSEFPSEQGA